MNKLTAMTKAQRPGVRVPKERVHNPTATPARRGKIGMTLHLSPEAHKILKSIALSEGVTILSLVHDGVNLVLQSYGESPIA